MPRLARLARDRLSTGQMPSPPARAVVVGYADVMRYPDGGGLTAAERGRTGKAFYSSATELS
jgi:hypothetical protein